MTRWLMHHLVLITCLGVVGALVAVASFAALGPFAGTVIVAVYVAAMALIFLAS